MSSWITGPTDGSKQVFRLSKPFRTSRVSLSTHLEEADGRSVLGQPRAIMLEVPSGRKEKWSVISIDVWYSVGCFRGWFWEKHTGLEGDFHLSFSLAVLLDLISLWLPIPKAIQLSASCGQCFLSILALLLPCLYLHSSRVLRVKGPHWNTARMGLPPILNDLMPSLVLLAHLHFIWLLAEWNLNLSSSFCFLFIQMFWYYC